MANTIIGFLLLAQCLLLTYLTSTGAINIHSVFKNNMKQLENSFFDDCSVNIVESIPIGLNYDKNWTVHMNTTRSWLNLINSAEKSIEIASMYWSMKREDIYPDDSAIEGEMVFKALKEAGKNRNISLKIVQNVQSDITSYNNTVELAKEANAQVRNLNVTKLLGSGILHTKLWIIDRKKVYVGSANMDWRALTQIKELGLISTCSKIAEDIGKIFDIYWYLSEEMKIPEKWPESFDTQINSRNPMILNFGGNDYTSFFASSPPQLTPKGRENDVDAILDCISRAKKFVYISVMDYFPLMIYSRPVKFWPVIDNALRKAALERKIRIKLLISWWSHSRKSGSYFLKSLSDISDSYWKVKIEVKRFIVPHTADQEKIPFARVNHNKYMVTDESAYVGTSNWSGDYFTNTAGIGMVFRSDHPNTKNDLRQQLQDIFDRDWNSPYAHPANSTG